MDKPNPVFGRMLQQAIGGPEGEMRVVNQYLFHAWGTRSPKKYRDMLINTGTEEIGRSEVVATAVAMNVDGMPSDACAPHTEEPVRHFPAGDWGPPRICTLMGLGGAA